MDNDDLPVNCDIDSLIEDGKEKILTEEGRRLIDEKEVKEMSYFPLEKILKVDLHDYLDSVGKEVSDYDLKGVHIKGYENGYVAEFFRAKVPLEAEVVVNYQLIPTRLDCSAAYGTALIPREPPKKEEYPPMMSQPVDLSGLGDVGLTDQDLDNLAGERPKKED